jgi:hypothetical protein
MRKENDGTERRNKPGRKLKHGTLIPASRYVNIGRAFQRGFVPSQNGFVAGGFGRALYHYRDPASLPAPTIKIRIPAVILHILSAAL